MQSGNRRGISALQAIRDLCAMYNVDEPSTFVAAQVIIENRISSVSRVVKLNDQLAEEKGSCNAYEKKNDTEASRQMDITGLILLQQKPVDRSINSFSNVVSLATSLKKARDEIRDMLG